MKWLHHLSNISLCVCEIKTPKMYSQQCIIMYMINNGSLELASSKENFMILTSNSQPLLASGIIFLSVL